MPAASENPQSNPSGTGLVVLTGNPNCGKTTIFNALTGLRAKVGNYAGVTVERKEGRLTGVKTDRPIAILDLPGTYSLSPKSLDEQVARDVLLGRLKEVATPQLVVVVVDASNLQRNLYYATQIIELGFPTLVALNMMDVAEENGHEIDVAELSRELGAPVIPTVANESQGLSVLRERIVAACAGTATPARPVTFAPVTGKFQDEVETLTRLVRENRPSPINTVEAVLLLSDEHSLDEHSPHNRPEIRDAVNAARARLEAAGVDWRGAAIEARYLRVAEIADRVVTEKLTNEETFSDRLDSILTHKLWGMLIFVAIMALMFQSIFTFAEIPMTLLEEGVAWFGELVAGVMPEGPLRSLVVDGAIAGVGAVVVFLPQICLLFLFIGLLEDTGYMARAAFLMDRLMSKVGLHGKSFIPMLSSFACAIPGIMATRTIETPKDRLVTILVAPLMSCSARLPVYTLLIGACIPDLRVLGFFKLGGVMMLSMYLLGITVALLMAWVFKKTLLKGATPMLIMELPPYKRPVLRIVLRHMWDRSKLFLRRAGTVILGINIILWFLATYPKDSSIETRFAAERLQTVRTVAQRELSEADAAKLISETRAKAGQPTLADADKRLIERLDELDKQEAGDKLRHSFAGRLGQLIAPVIEPLGMDWKIGIGIVASFAAREVFVSTMSTVYNVGGADDDEGIQNLAQTLQQQTRDNGTVLYTPLLGVTLMVFYVFALQCVSTIAVVRRETNSWKWPVFQWLYMGTLAWVLAFLTWHGGKLLGFQ